MPIPFLPKRISSFRVSFGELRTKGSEEALGGFKVIQLTLVLGTALQQVTGGSYRQETLGRVPYQLYVNLHGNSKDCRRSQRGDNRIRTRNQVE